MFMAGSVAVRCLPSYLSRVPSQRPQENALTSQILRGPAQGIASPPLARSRSPEPHPSSSPAPSSPLRLWTLTPLWTLWTGAPKAARPQRPQWLDQAMRLLTAPTASSVEGLSFSSKTPARPGSGRPSRSPYPPPQKRLLKQRRREHTTPGEPLCAVLPP